MGFRRAVGEVEGMHGRDYNVRVRLEGDGKGNGWGEK